eukprot:CAMPEP_0185575730 /NCGR_PEP_ID=MMETSP0434-20130131/6841_1 /TAXON_ID=626734 ORGANISM="Favella taraikaensis, Strain Fe Narragansett Bay" /NCGR_SAMPLE_ID=MMETSP0434 /ASSEMBLY_ACC=CAM_ASM_000379 /LENGTH=85 /DNA_ID=CAMNT_0028192685 /DNA_START=256 /DNA_END=513 /DNA_ORIENTATION=+
MGLGLAPPRGLVRADAARSLEEMMSVEELGDEDVLLVRVFAVLAHPVEEFGDADIVVLQELNDVHTLPVLHLLANVRVLLQELGD